FVLEYLRTHNPGERKRLLDAYQAERPLGSDELTQLIALLPPPEPADTAAMSPHGVEERTTLVPWSQHPPISYALQLPPEYQPQPPAVRELDGQGLPVADDDLQGPAVGVLRRRAAQRLRLDEPQAAGQRLPRVGPQPQRRPVERGVPDRPPDRQPLLLAGGGG